MDEAIYNTSFTLYTVPLPCSALLLSLLSSSGTSLGAHATTLQAYLGTNSRRPAYEAEEEQEKLGSLRSCNFSPLASVQGVTISINYDRATYKFILYPSASTKQSPLLLAKANASLTRRCFAYLTEAFRLTAEPEPLKLSSYLLLSALQNYIISLRKSLDPVAETESILSLLRDIIGTLRITISINPGSAQGSQISGTLRTVDLDVPSETLYQLLDGSMREKPGSRPKKRDAYQSQATFLAVLRDFTLSRTGLKLPITPVIAKKPLTTNTNGTVLDDEPPLRVTRIHSTAFAISTEGRLKFSSKPVEMMNVIPGLTSGDENVVKVTNRDLLEAIVREAEGAQNPG